MTLKVIKDTCHDALNVINALRYLLKFLLSLRLLCLAQFRAQYTMNAMGKTITPARIRDIETGRAMSVPVKYYKSNIEGKMAQSGYYYNWS